MLNSYMIQRGASDRIVRLQKEAETVRGFSNIRVSRLQRFLKTVVVREIAIEVQPQKAYTEGVF